MIKRIIVCILLLSTVAFIGSYAHQFVLSNQLLVPSFSLEKIYWFFAIATIIIYTLIELVCIQMPKQAGFVYLATLFLKIGVFVMVFKDEVFLKEKLAMFEKGIVLIPLFLYLIIEVLAVSKQLSKDQIHSN